MWSNLVAASTTRGRKSKFPVGNDVSVAALEAAKAAVEARKGEATEWEKVKNLSCFNNLKETA